MEVAAVWYYNRALSSKEHEAAVAHLRHKYILKPDLEQSSEWDVHFVFVLWHFEWRTQHSLHGTTCRQQRHSESCGWRH